MTKSEILARIIKDMGLQTSVEKLPTKLGDRIVPVVVSNPERIITVVKQGGASATLYATPANKDFFLTSLSLTSTSQNASASVEDRIAIVLESGEAITSVLSCVCSSGAASENSNSNSVTFTPPIKLARSSNVSLVKGSSSTRAVLTGYLVEVE